MLHSRAFTIAYVLMMTGAAMCQASTGTGLDNAVSWMESLFQTAAYLFFGAGLFAIFFLIGSNVQFGGLIVTGMIALFVIGGIFALWPGVAAQANIAPAATLTP